MTATIAYGTPVKAQKPSTIKTVITREEIEAAINACAKKKEADTIQAAAEKASKAHMTNIFSKLFPGKVVYFEDIAGLDPDQVSAAFAQVGKTIIAEVDFHITKTSERRMPSWKDEYVKEKGEVAALNVVNNTPKSYSYRIIP